MMVAQEKERSKKGGESRSQETCSTEHRARQSAACGNGARCVGHRNALHLPSQRTASPDQQSSSTTGKPMTIWLHHQGRDDEDADDARRKTMVIWFYHCRRHTEGADGAKRKPADIAAHSPPIGSPDKPRGLSIQPCKSEKEEPYIRYSSQGRSECLYLRIE